VGVKIDPLNLFINISRRSEILGKGVEPLDSPANTALDLTSLSSPARIHRA